MPLWTNVWVLVDTASGNVGDIWCIYMINKVFIPLMVQFSLQYLGCINQQYLNWCLSNCSNIDFPVIKFCPTGPTDTKNNMFTPLELTMNNQSDVFRFFQVYISPANMAILDICVKCHANMYVSFARFFSNGNLRILEPSTVSTLKRALEKLKKGK